MKRSPTRTLDGQSTSAWDGTVGQAHLAEPTYLAVRSLVGQAELAEAIRRPPSRVRIRWLAHQQQAADLQERRRALRGGWRRTESAGDDQVELMAQRRVVCGGLGSVPAHRNAILQTQPRHGLLEEGCPPLVGVQERPSTGWPRDGEYESGHSTAAAEVECQFRWVDDQERFRVAQMISDRARPDEPQALGSFERLGQRVDQSLSAAVAGMITTRRRGSSPSEVVATPSMSLTVSCTTLRSAGCMGSSALAVPDASTSWAT